MNIASGVGQLAARNSHQHYGASELMDPDLW